MLGLNDLRVTRGFVRYTYFMKLILLALASFYVWLVSAAFFVKVIPQHASVEPSRTDDQHLGIAVPQGSAIFETSLQSRISSTDTSMTLVAKSVRGGSTLSGYQCFTMDEGRTDPEYIRGTISGRTVSSLSRGIDPPTGTITTAALTRP